jgi:glyoxylase-like metal-dependent hydrolase (beta-lactamase superfamily II)
LNIGEEVAAGLHQLPVPLPYATKPVNAYLGRVEGGWAVVDTGAHTEATERFWAEVLEGLDAPLAAVYVTHYHPDHLGMAGWLAGRTGAPVHMMRREFEWARFMWAEGMPQADSMADLCRRNGMPPDGVEAVRLGMLRQRPDTLPFPDGVRPLADGDEVELGGARYRVLWLSGHSDGLYCLWDERARVLVSNDHVLPSITPNVSVWPNGDPAPLRRYLENLRRVLELDPALYLPGHGSPFTAADGRVQRIIDHHERRLAAMLEVVGPAGASAWEVCAAAFRAEDLNGHQLRFAMAETLAHMELLAERGLVRAVDDGGLVRYRRAA